MPTKNIVVLINDIISMAGRRTSFHSAESTRPIGDLSNTNGGYIDQTVFGCPHKGLSFVGLRS